MSPEAHISQYACLIPIHCLDRRVQEGRTGAVDHLMLVRSDPDERMRTRALL